MTEGTMGARGDLAIRVTRATKAPLLWRLKNAARWAYVKGWVAFHLVRPFAAWWGLLVACATLRIRVHRAATGTWEDFGIVGYRVVTTAGVGFIVDAFQNTTELENLKYHGIGTGNTAEASGDTALVTESTTALNPDSTRATGSTTEASANVYRTVGTLTADASIAAVEHGVFSQAATGGGTLLDRTVFSTVNLASGDSIQFTYDLTFSAGG